MGTVVGYKGTPQERLTNWNTLLLLRKSIAYSKSQGFKDAESIENKWYREDFGNYLKGAA